MTENLGNKAPECGVPCLIIVFRLQRLPRMGLNMFSDLGHTLPCPEADAILAILCR